MTGPILVTGGAGFVGSHVVDALLHAGWEVRVLDRRRGPDGAEWIEGDVRDAHTVAAAVAGVDAVCHHAAMTGDYDDAADCVATNDFGTAVLLSGLADRGFAGRLVLGSSTVVYGEGLYACASHGSVRPARRAAKDLDAGRFDHPCPACGAPLEPRAVPEQAAREPRGVYAATKLAQELLCTALGDETAAKVTILRYDALYGPRMTNGMLGAFRSALRNGDAPRVFEDGRQLRDFVHVRDVARATLLALADTPPGAYNVASGTPRTVKALADALSRAFGGAEPLVTRSWRAGDVRHRFGETTAAAERLGFHAAEDFEAGMRECV